MSGNVPYSSVAWMDLNGTTADSVNLSVGFEGACVSGLGFMVNDFITSNNLTMGRVETWMAPYDNVFFVNLRWMRQHALLLEFMEAVDTTGCIFSNRWGDHALWGAALTVTSTPKYVLNMTYVHGSHHSIVRPHTII